MKMQTAKQKHEAYHSYIAMLQTALWKVTTTHLATAHLPPHLIYPMQQRPPSTRKKIREKKVVGRRGEQGGMGAADDDDDDDDDSKKSREEPQEEEKNGQRSTVNTAWHGSAVCAGP